MFSHSTGAGRFQAGRLPDAATALGDRLLPRIGPVSPPRAGNFGNGRPQNQFRHLAELNRRG